jgi:hypothetical protein
MLEHQTLLAACCSFQLPEGSQAWQFVTLYCASSRSLSLELFKHNNFAKNRVRHWSGDR